MLAAPTEQRLTDTIDTIAAAAINTGARVTALTAQYIDDEKALASVGIDPWTTRPSDDLTGQADRILYVGRDGARIHVKAGRIIVDAPGALPATSLPKNSVTRIVLSGNVGLSADARTCTPGSAPSQACAPSTKSWASKALAPTPTSTRSPRAYPPTSPSMGAADAHPATCPTPPCPTGTRSSCPSASARCTPPGSNRHSASRAPTDKRPSLVLDLTEQFRPLLVDQTVMALLRTRTLRPEHGVREAEAGEGWLGADGKKILADAYEAACQRSVTGALPGYSGS